MCLSDRDNVRYELGQPADVQSNLVQHLLGDDYDVARSHQLRSDLRVVCRSKANTYWRLRRVTRDVLLTALAERDTARLQMVLERLEHTLTSQLLQEYLNSYKHAALRRQSAQLATA